jgi:hypothetical protein
LRTDPTSQAALLDCLAAAKSKGTVSGYSNTVRRFESFCQLHGYEFPHFSSVAVTQFVLHQVTRQSGFSFLATIKPALTYLEQSLDHPTAFTPAIDLLISGDKRRAKQRTLPCLPSF